MQAPSMLMAKIRELETAISQKDEQLRMIKSSMKFTLIKVTLFCNHQSEMLLGITNRGADLL